MMNLCEALATQWVTVRMEIEGAFIYENLLAARRGDAWLGSTEIQLLSDSWILGEYTDPPYEYLNTVTGSSGTQVNPVIVLRVHYHWKHAWPSGEWKTDAKRYHKGWIDDEAAALASLILGIRIQCGAKTRDFRPSDPVQGRPCYIRNSNVMGFPIKTKPILPSHKNTVNLSDLERIHTIELLSPEQSIALVKAARLYQQALWLAEVDAADAWLSMVSAIETAASCWKAEQQSSMDELRSCFSDLYIFLSKFNNHELLEGTAEILKGKNRIKNKFVNFLINFLPSAPPLRPPGGFQLQWDSEFFRPAFAKVYEHRSRALHDGIAFPLPMTEPPEKHDEHWAAPTERPGGIATSNGIAVWNHEDCPMLLNTFAYIVRKALLSWWNSIQNKDVLH